MRTNDSRYMQPIMAEIAHADPTTFKRMEAADWLVTVVDRPDDLRDIIRKNPEGGYALMQSLGQANGVTVKVRPAYRDEAEILREFDGNTWLNRPYIKAEADSYGVSPVKYAADILVHEYAHRAEDADEPEAYDAGISFAHKMGEPEIARAQQFTKDEVQYRADMEQRAHDYVPGQRRGQLDGPLGELLRLIEEGSR